jgi:hypothetical protein
MGFWTSGPVIGSLIVSVVGSATVPAIVNDPHFWTHEYRICGIAGLIVFVIALVGLKELSPRLRDQLMVTMRDRALIEAKAKGLTDADIEAALRHPFRQLLKADVIVSSIAVSIMLLIYYTAVGFSVIYLTTVFGLSVKDANGLGNWNWGFNVLAVILVGIISDRFRVRKPFMVIGGVLAAVMTVIYLEQAGHHPVDGQLHRDGGGPQPGAHRHRPGHLGLDHPDRGLRRVPDAPAGDQHRHPAGELRGPGLGLCDPVRQPAGLRHRAPGRRSDRAEDPPERPGLRSEDPAGRPDHRED